MPPTKELAESAPETSSRPTVDMPAPAEVEQPPRVRAIEQLRPAARILTSPAAEPGAVPRARSVTRLQETVGNSSVGRMLAVETPPRPAPAATPSTATRVPQAEGATPVGVAAPPAQPPPAPRGSPAAAVAPPVAASEEKAPRARPEHATAREAPSQQAAAAPDAEPAAAAATGPSAAAEHRRAVPAERPAEGAAQPAAPEAAAVTPAAPGAEAPAGEAEPPARRAAPVLETGNSEGLLQSVAAEAPSMFPAATTQAGGAVYEVQSREKRELAESLPVIEQPTGMTPGERPDAPPTEVEGPPPEDVPAEAREGEAPPVDTPPPAAPVPGEELPIAAPPDDEAAREQAVDQFVHGLPVTDPSLSTSAGPRPQVDLTGDADPALDDERLQAAGQDVASVRQSADLATSQDFGETAIAPTIQPQLLRSQRTPTAPRAAQHPPLVTPNVAAEVYAGIDREGRPWLDENTSRELGREGEARATYAADSQRIRDEGDQRLAEETERTRQEQERLSAEARGDVAARREEWRAENERIEADFSQRAETRRQETQRQVDERVQSAEHQADEELTRAEQRAETERRRTEAEAAAKQREEENKPRSWWDSVVDAISAVFDALKEAFVAMFDGLRKIVHGIIEGAKRLVHGLIEAARAAIVGFIRAFGEFLKGLVTIALAAFPEAAARARAWIDNRVNQAVDRVNRAAEALKRACDAILDFVESALDAALDVLQAAVLFVISVYEFLCIGLIEIMRKLGNLVDAAREMPDHFLGQVSEELLGMNLGEPLPFERTAPPAVHETAAAARDAGAIGDADAAVLQRPTLGDGDVAVDNVLPNEFSPELIRQIARSPSGEIELPGNAGPELADEARAGAVGGAGPEGETVHAGPPGAGVPARAQTPEEELQELMNQEPPETCGTQEAETPAQSSQVPEFLKKGPFTVGQRLRYVMNQMWKGVKHWFHCNWGKILLAAIGILLGLIVAELLTGGAITAALPLLMEVITAVMIGVAIVRVTSYIGDYLTKGWAGDITGAAKALARGLAIGAIELIFALMFNLDAVIKSLRAGLRASAEALAESAKETFRATVRNVRQLGRIAAQGARTAVRNGRLLLQGLRAGFARGVRTLEELVGRLFRQLRFRRFKIVLRDGWIRLLGWINPWVVLMEGPLRGELQEVSDDWVRQLAKEGKGLGGVGRVATSAGEDVKAMLVALRDPDDYREIFRLFHGLTSSDMSELVVHHVIERQTRKLFAGVEELSQQFLNAPARLRPFEKGAINSVFHLSRIRLMWNRMYPVLRQLGDQAIARGLVHFAEYTDRFILAMDEVVRVARAEGKDVTREMLEHAADAWIEGHNIEEAVSAARAASGGVAPAAAGTLVHP